MNLVAIGRVAAAGLSLSTFTFLFLHDSWDRENLFLIPDLLFCLVLLIAAVLPARLAVTAMALGFAFSAGVLATSVSSYAVRGEFGFASLLGAITAAVFAVLLAASPGPAAR